MTTNGLSIMFHLYSLTFSSFQLLIILRCRSFDSGFRRSQALIEIKHEGRRRPGFSGLEVMEVDLQCAYSRASRSCMSSLGKRLSEHNGVFVVEVEAVEMKRDVH